MTDSDKEPTMYDHTPEPFQVVPNNSGSEEEATVFDIDAWDTVAEESVTVGNTHCGDVSQYKARCNAELFKAAPRLLRERDELLEALRDCVPFLDSDDLQRFVEPGLTLQQKLSAVMKTTTKGDTPQ